MVKVFEVCKHKMRLFLWLYLNTIRQHKVLALYIHTCSIYKKHPGRTYGFSSTSVSLFFSWYFGLGIWLKLSKSVEKMRKFIKFLDFRFSVVLEIVVVLNIIYSISYVYAYIVFYDVA